MNVHPKKRLMTIVLPEFGISRPRAMIEGKK